MSLYSDLNAVLTPYANKIKELATSDDQIKADLDNTFDVNFVYDEHLTTDSEGVTTLNAYASYSGNGKITSNDAYRAIYFQAQEDCYVYPTVATSSKTFAVYSDLPLSASTCVYVTTNTGAITATKPYAVEAGQYVLLSEHTVTPQQVIHLSTREDYTLKDDTIKKYGTLVYADITDVAGFASGYVNTSGEKSSAGNTSKEVVTDFLPCTYGQYMHGYVDISASSTPWCRYALYDANKTFLASGTTYKTVTDGNVKHMDIPVNTEVEGVAFARISFRTYGSTTYGVTIVPDSSYLYESLSISEEAPILDYAKFPAESELPINVLHRGLATANYPENTIVAYKDAIEKGWKYLETDIRRTSDDVWVLLHDYEINRTARNTDGTAISGSIGITTITYEQALSYDFGIYAGAEFAGTKIATLDDFLKLCRAKHAYPVIEVKDSDITQSQADAVWSLVEKYGMENRVFFLCSSVGGVTKFLAKNPFIPVINTSASNWTYIDPANFAGTSPYSLGYKTGKNRVFAEKEVSGFSSKSDMDNYVDYCHYHGLYAGFYCPTTKASVNNTSDRIDMATTQYYQYSDVKAEYME